MTVLTAIISVILCLAALFLIVTVLLQSSTEKGLGAIAGTPQDTYFNKSKNKSFEAKMALYTKIAAIVFIVLAIVLLAINKFAA